MSAIRSASSMAVISMADRSDVCWVMWSVRRPGWRPAGRHPAAARRPAGRSMPPTTGGRPSAGADGASASMHLLRPARGWGRAPGHAASWPRRPPSRRATSARPKARVLPEPVWPRPSRSRPAACPAGWRPGWGTAPRSPHWSTRGPAGAAGRAPRTRAYPRRAPSRAPPGRQGGGEPGERLVAVGAGLATAGSAGAAARRGSCAAGRRQRRTNEPPGRGTSHGKAAPRCGG